MRVRHEDWSAGRACVAPLSAVLRGASIAIRRAGGLTWIAYLAGGCEPELIVGSRTCDSAPLVEGTGGTGATVASGLPVEMPWAADFENGFCDYVEAGGFCYRSPDAVYETVDTEAHSGTASAAFRISSDPAVDAEQARCVREGIFPIAAYYGAWYFVPTAAENSGNWNLMHFQGQGDTSLRGLWDVSLGSNDDGDLYVYVYDFLGGGGQDPDPEVQVPIGEWFHIVFFMRRASDETGEVGLYMNDRLIWGLTDIATDDSTWGQWYVGNLADRLTPADSTVYVDDVTIRGTL